MQVLCLDHFDMLREQLILGICYQLCRCSVLHTKQWKLLCPLQAPKSVNGWTHVGIFRVFCGIQPTLTRISQASRSHSLFFATTSPASFVFVPRSPNLRSDQAGNWMRRWREKGRKKTKWTATISVSLFVSCHFPPFSSLFHAETCY